VKLIGEEKVRSAKVISKNTDNFMTLLKLPEARYPALDIGLGVNIGDKVYKASARSGFSEGIVQDIKGRINLNVPSGPTVLKDVITTSAISEAGDSGSPVLNESMKVIGVVVAGSETKTIIVPIAQVIAAFPQAFSR
jgi:S1-C subfamily serine protease